jgi:type I restriction enzyme S subunit
MAKQLYDYWFVQFDFPDENGRPYKSSGGKMVWNEKLKREIPYDWNVLEFQDICSIKRGASPRPIDAFMDSSKTGIRWLKISDATCDMSPFITEIKEYIITEGIKKSVYVTPGTLVVSNSATPGIPKFLQVEACVHDGWLVLDSYRSCLRYYIFYFIKMVRDSLVHLATGSVFKNLNTDYLKEHLILLPTDDVLYSFESKVSQIMGCLLNAQQQIHSLTKQRDELLPLLMNGQVSVTPPAVNCDL